MQRWRGSFDLPFISKHLYIEYDYYELIDYFKNIY